MKSPAREALAAQRNKAIKITSAVHCRGRFDLRFFRPFRADLSRNHRSSFHPLIAATSHGLVAAAVIVSLSYVGATSPWSPLISNRQLVK
jgi:hypothetical protein